MIFEIREIGKSKSTYIKCKDDFDFVIFPLGKSDSIISIDLNYLIIEIVFKNQLRHKFENITSFQRFYFAWGQGCLTNSLTQVKNNELSCMIATITRK